MMTKKSIRGGFTLLELLVAISISALGFILLTRLFSVSLTNYNLQEQLGDMNQNARFTVKELSDILMQAGADLQLVNLDTLDKDTVIVPDNNAAQCSGFTIKTNPRGGLYQIPDKIGSPTPISSIQVDNARRFRCAEKIQRVPALGSKLPLKFYSLTSIDTNTNYIVFSPADSFNQDDAICSIEKNRYYLDGGNLCINNASNVIAENIDSLSIVFLDRKGNLTALWPSMRSVRLFVRTKMAQPDPRYKEYSDHRRRVTMTYEFRLRNKVGI